MAIDPMVARARQEMNSQSMGMPAQQPQGRQYEYYGSPVSEDQYNSLQRLYQMNQDGNMTDGYVGKYAMDILDQQEDPLEKQKLLESELSLLYSGATAARESGDIARADMLEGRANKMSDDHFGIESSTSLNGVFGIEDLEAKSDLATSNMFAKRIDDAYDEQGVPDLETMRMNQYFQNNPKSYRQEISPMDRVNYMSSQFGANPVASLGSMAVSPLAPLRNLVADDRIKYGKEMGTTQGLDFGPFSGSPVDAGMNALRSVY